MQHQSTERNDNEGADSENPLVRIGILRLLVAGFVLVCLPMVFFTGTSRSGWGIIPSQVMPGLVLFMAWALPFDMLMARVFMADKEGRARQRYKLIIALDALLLVALVVFWGPFFLALIEAG